MSDPEPKLSKGKRRGLWFVALLCAVGPWVAAALLGSSEEPPEPRTVAEAPSRGTPVRAQRERPKPRREKPKPEPKRKKRRNLEVRIDRNAADPVAVSVRSADISAPVIPLGLKRNGEIEVPKDISEAGWHKRGPEPGERGAAMITAHVNGGGQPGAFANLASVGEGDKIQVDRKDGTTVAFRVNSTERVPKDDFPTKKVYGKTPLPTLRLVTCGGTFDSTTGHYRENVIVYATRLPS